jgi:hypothetical protein
MTRRDVLKAILASLALPGPVKSRAEKDLSEEGPWKPIIHDRSWIQPMGPMVIKGRAWKEIGRIDDQRSIAIHTWSFCSRSLMPVASIVPMEVRVRWDNAPQIPVWLMDVQTECVWEYRTPLAQHLLVSPMSTLVVEGRTRSGNTVEVYGSMRGLI